MLGRCQLCFVWWDHVEAYHPECGHDPDGWHSLGDVSWPLEDVCLLTAAAG